MRSVWGICLYLSCHCVDPGISGTCREDELTNLKRKCTTQPVNKNTFGKIPSIIATYLRLSDPTLYTGHCLRRSSATLLADAGANIMTIKHHESWKSTTVAEGYIDNSVQNKTNIANQVLQAETTVKKTINLSK
ncbi:hypothetical protein NQ317_002195, partial [Molorchus minor]